MVSVDLSLLKRALQVWDGKLDSQMVPMPVGDLMLQCQASFERQFFIINVYSHSYSFVAAVVKLLEKSIGLEIDVQSKPLNVTSLRDEGNVLLLCFLSLICDRT